MAGVPLARALAQRSDSELLDLHDRWVGGAPPRGRAALLQELRNALADPARVRGEVAALSDEEQAVFEALCARIGPTETARLREDLGPAARRNGDLVSLLADLLARGLVARLAARSPGAEPRWAVPREVAAALRAPRTAPEGGPPALSLLDWLERRAGQTGGAARKLYRLVADEGGIRARVAGLEAPHREAVRRLAVDHGGLLAWDRVDELGAGDAEALVEALAGASLGAAGELDLEDFGLRQRGRVVALFHEVVVAVLQGEAETHPVVPHEEASFGVDFVSNFSRFASFVEGDTVRFTARGTIFKSTGRRIAERLLPNPGKEFRRLEILELEYRFALERRLIERTGQRSFRLTSGGQDFLRLPLVEKQRVMLSWLLEDRTLPGDLTHQLPLRRLVLRWLKRLEPGRWYDAMFLPFVVRNHYLASLLEGRHDEEAPKSFPVRSSADLRSLSWNLFLWMRKYLYLLGVLDLGYDATGRAVALRLTRMGAELLELIPSRDLAACGHLVVNPDFEVVLFPEEGCHRLIHDLDRFCERESKDALYHYRITPGSLHRALAEGMGLDAILELLERHSRTPVPQNVAYSLESWARKSGLVTVHAGRRLHCELSEILDRLAAHPKLGAVGVERSAPEWLELGAPVAAEVLTEAARDLGVGVRFLDDAA